MSQPTVSQPAPEPPRSPTPAPTRKRKHRPWMPQKNARRRMKQFAQIACNMVELALPIAAGAASDAGVPGLSSALEALLEILKKIQAMKTNVKGVETLATRITTLKDALEKLLSQHERLSDDMRQRIEALTKLWTRVAADAKDIKCRGMIKRFFTSNIDARKLQDLVEEVNQSIQDFVAQAMLTIEANVHAVRQDVKALRTQQEMTLLSPYAINAAYNSSSVRRECLKGTRNEVLADAYSWIHESSMEVATCAVEERSGHFLWINGGAGMGKTTIACSIAKKYDDRGTLGASFFCSRADAQCRDPKFIFVTIARQLCQYHEPFKEKVVAVLLEKRDIVNTKPLDQFKALILQPLRELKGEFPTCVIVIDALDECQNEGITSEILDILACHIRELVPFLFVVTSRPEPHITTLFERETDVSLKHSTKPLILHNVRLKSVEGDIRRYLVDGFSKIRRGFIIEGEWPSSQDVTRLVELSKGLFIFATTVLRFIGDADYSNPKEQLQTLLTASVSIMTDLYREVLTRTLAYKNISTLHKTNPSLRQVLGAITLAEKPLSAPAIANLLGMLESDVRNTLSRLRSVLHIPEDSEDAILFIHPTFPEFLLNASETKPEAFCIVPAEHHLALLEQSLVAMHSLKRNIAGIEKPTLFGSEIPGLSDTVKTCIPVRVASACRFWGAHLWGYAKYAQMPSYNHLLDKFLRTQILYWLEACSLLGMTDKVLAVLKIAEHACETLGGPFASLTLLLADCYRFLWMCYPCIDAAPLQVYHSALALAPTESLFKKVYIRELDSSLIVRSGVHSSWPPRRHVFRGHDGKPVYAVAFPPRADYFITDGEDSFVTGGGDNKLNMLTALGMMIRSFSGHTRAVACVAFSPDGVHLASGSSDRDVRVWQVLSGECVRTLKGHTSRVSSVVYSVDGRRLLSASDWGEAKLWDTSDWHCIIALGKTDSFTWQAGLSPDGGVIARGKGASMCLYNVSSTTEESLDVPSTAQVKECTFSRDGRYVAARSDRNIRIWAYEDRSVVRSITTEETQWSRLAFSHDGTHIGCGSGNGSVYLWRVASEDPPLVIKGHSDGVGDLAWSPDGQQIVSVAEDGDVRMSDVTQSPAHNEEPTALQPPPAHSGPLRFALARHKGHTALLHLPSASVDVADFAAAASMPEGAPALTPFADMADALNAAPQLTKYLSETTRRSAWAVITGQRRVDVVSPWYATPPICISPDGSLLAYQSPTSGNVVDVCNLRAGKVVASLTGHTRDVSSIAFSPDSSLIATGSIDKSVKVWNATTGGVLHSHKTHTDWVRALTFSSDGRLVASGSDDTSVHVFEAATGSVEQVFDNHRNWVTKVVFAAGNKRVLALDFADWVYIWDMATGTRTYEMSVAGDSWTRSLTFSADSDGIPAEVEDPKQRPLPLCDPGNRSLPEYTVSKDGWVYAWSPGRAARLCWLPPEWRILLSWDGAKFRCFDEGRRTVVEFDVSRLPEYVQTWGSIM